MALHGLFSVKDGTPVHLESVDVQVFITGFVAKAHSVLTYKNSESTSIETLFTFPLDENAAVYHFQAQVGNTIVVAECQHKTEADATYSQATEMGYSAFLLEGDENTADVFRCRVGNIPSHSTAIISYTYVIELLVEVDKSVVYKLPQVLNPRYSPTKSQSDTLRHYGHGIRGGQVALFSGKMTFSATIEPFTWSVKHISTDYPHLEWRKTNDNKRIQVNLNGGLATDRDLRFAVLYDDPTSPLLITESAASNTDGFLSSDVALLSFFPSFPLPNKSHKEKREFVFIIDRSGSMVGEKMNKTKQTLLYFLKSLPTDCYFNIISFGYDTAELFSKGSKKYSLQMLTEALQLQSSMEADMGGTEILEPLKLIFSQPLIEGYARTIFLMTDGEVTNTRQVIQEVARNSHNARVFTFGIGEGASTALVNGVARAGNGKAEFIFDVALMQKKVLSSLKLSLQATLNNVSIQWNSDKVVTIPTHIASILPNARVNVYGLLKSRPAQPLSARLLGVYGGQQLVVDVKFGAAVLQDDSLLIHRLAAKAQIRQLEDELETTDDEKRKEEIKKQLLAVSLASNVLSCETAYVGVNKETRHALPIPTQVPPTLFFGSRMAYLTGMDMVDSAPMVMDCVMDYVDGGDFMDVADSVGGGHFEDCVDTGPMERNRGIDVVDSFRGIEVADSFRGSDVADSGPSVPAAETPLDAVVVHQSFDGCWSWSVDLLKTLNVDSQKCSRLKPDVKDDVWMTVVVVQWLACVLAAQAEEWELLVDKAHAWLDAQGVHKDQLLAVARQLFPAA